MKAGHRVTFRGEYTNLKDGCVVREEAAVVLKILQQTVVVRFDNPIVDYRSEEQLKACMVAWGTGWGCKDSITHVDEVPLELLVKSEDDGEE